MKKEKTPQIPKPLTEDQECFDLAMYLDLRKIKYSHIPSETYTKFWSVINRNKKLWVKKWLPDYIITIPANKSKDWTSYLLFIEMKRKKWWIVSDEQKERIDVLNLISNNVKAFICRWFFDAKIIIENFI